MEFPGNQVGSGEEYLSASGTFEENGVIYCAAIGKKKIENYAVSIQAKKLVENLKKGDIVIGVVLDVFDQVARIKIEPEQRNVAYSNSYAYLRISEVTQGYAKRFRDYIRIGDVIKAEVLEVTKLDTYLTMANEGLGVIKTRSSKINNKKRDSNGSN